MIEAQRSKPPTPTRETDVLIRDEEQERKTEEKETKREQLLLTIRLPPTTSIDDAVSLFF